MKNKNTNKFIRVYQIQIYIQLFVFTSMMRYKIQIYIPNKNVFVVGMTQEKD